MKGDAFKPSNGTKVAAALTRATALLQRIRDEHLVEYEESNLFAHTFRVMVDEFLADPHAEPSGIGDALDELNRRSNEAGDADTRLVEANKLQQTASANLRTLLADAAKPKVPAVSPRKVRR